MGKYHIFHENTEFTPKILKMGEIYTDSDMCWLEALMHMRTHVMLQVHAHVMLQVHAHVMLQVHAHACTCDATSACTCIHM